MSEAEITCAACGTVNHPGARFCQECGTPLVAGPAAATDPPATTTLPQSSTAGQPETAAEPVVAGSLNAPDGGPATGEAVAETGAAAPTDHAEAAAVTPTEPVTPTKGPPATPSTPAVADEPSPGAAGAAATGPGTEDPPVAEARSDSAWPGVPPVPPPPPLPPPPVAGRGGRADGNWFMAASPQLILTVGIVLLLGACALITVASSALHGALDPVAFCLGLVGLVVMVLGVIRMAMGRPRRRF